MKNIINKIVLFSILSFFLYSCHDDLDLSPIDPDSFTEEDVFSNATEAKGALAKLYTSLALTGQEGPHGDPDIVGIDEGFSPFSRLMFNLNEVTTDHAVVGWPSVGLPDLHGLSWSASNVYSAAMYTRLAQIVTFCNSFIENAAALEDPVVVAYIAEAKFIRAYAYYNLMDWFANVPLTTEISTDLPEQSNRTEIFDFIESDLLEIQDQLLPSGSNEYGRVDETAAWALLSRIYLNAEVWIGTAKYIECIDFSYKVMTSSYTINMNDANGNGTAYDELFLADNNTNGANNEFIFVLNFDGLQTQTWGGTTYLIHAAIGGNMNPTEFGVNGGWAGLRTTKNLVNKFPVDLEGSNTNLGSFSSDKRGMFHTDGQNLEIEDIPTFTDGYAITKFKNVDSNGYPGRDASGNFPDTDLPILRLAEIYLNYAEATLRGGGGDVNLAVTKINELRLRAYGNTSGDINSADLTLEFVLDERSRELYWEGQRRTDLIRYDFFTTDNYLWPFKGNDPNGISVGNHRNIYPIPNNVLTTNPNLSQNDGY